jgi:hypothetical protein
MRRGTVLETFGGSAVILTPDGEFVRVKAEEGVQIGQEIAWSEADRLPAAAPRVSQRMRRWTGAASAAAALLLLTAALWSFRTPPVVAYVSMDINPSIEMGLDAKERVRKLTALNPDAESLVAGVAFKGRAVEEVTREVAGQLAASHLLDDLDQEVVIASVRVKQVDRQWEAQVTGKIERVLKQTAGAKRQSATGEEAKPADSLTVETVFLPAEVREEARQNGVSSGKMAVWLAAEHAGYDIPLSELKEIPVKSISSSLGGLQNVMEKGKIDETDRSVWKKLLENQKNKKGLSSQPSPSASQRQEKNGKPEKSEKPKKSEKPEKSGKSEKNGTPLKTGSDDQPVRLPPAVGREGNGPDREAGSVADMGKHDWTRLGKGDGKGAVPGRDWVKDVGTIKGKGSDPKNGSGKLKGTDISKGTDRGKGTSKGKGAEKGQGTDKGRSSNPDKRSSPGRQK